MRHTMRINVAVAMLLVTWALSPPVGAASLFASHEPLDVTLEGPFGDLFRKRRSGRSYPFTLRVGDMDHAVTLRGRGKSRLETCRFPPLRIEFTAEPPADSPFAGQKRLKLVTHCRDRESWVQNVPREYAAYRIFNLLSPVSFAVRALNVTYIDEDGETDGATPAFVIESTDELAARVGGVEVEIPGVTLGGLDDTQEARVYVFQYLIGNTDWSLVTALEEEDCCHNGKLVDRDGSLFYVPYDFDLSGLVDAAYAKPDYSMHIRGVTERLFRGFCALGQDALRDAISETVDLQEDILDVVRQAPWQDEETRSEMLEYLGEYFAEARDPEALLASFKEDCLR